MGEENHIPRAAFFFSKFWQISSQFRYRNSNLTYLLDYFTK